MNDTMQILVLGHENAGRRELKKTLTRLGYVVLSADPSTMSTPPASGDMIMFDLRCDGHDEELLAEALRCDDRPLVAVAETPTDAVRRLIGRPAGTMVLTGSESDAGYRVALSVCQALLRGATSRRAERSFTAEAALA